MPKGGAACNYRGMADQMDAVTHSGGPARLLAGPRQGLAIRLRSLAGSNTSVSVDPTRIRFATEAAGAVAVQLLNRLQTAVSRCVMTPLRQARRAKGQKG